MAVFLLMALSLMTADARAAGAAEPQASGMTLAIETVSPGREGLEFSAHLAGSTRPLARNLFWTISTADGVDVYSGQAPAVDLVSPPGDYIVNVQYGSGRLTKAISLQPGSRLKVDFALNAGGLRIVPRAGGAALPAGGAKIRVFTLQQGQPNPLMAVNATAGEVLPLPEGRYRVESQIGDGNAKAVAEVAVKAGRLSTLEIGHKLGIAKLTFKGSADADVQWAIDDAAGMPVATREGRAASIILAPGRYTAKADAEGRTITAAFTIAPGKSRHIVLGN